jgi:hypothetical protein
MAYEKIKVLDYKAFGLLVKRWAEDPMTRPGTIDDFKTATAGILDIPARITKDPVYPQWSTDDLVIRLPAKELLKQSEDELDANPGKYPFPLFYEELVAGTLVGRPALYHRVGDYTIAQCI